MIEIILHSLAAGMGTCLGAFVIILLGRMNSGTLALLLGFASGIMGAVVISDLLPVSLQYGNPAICVAGFGSGFLLVSAMDYSLGKIMPGRYPHHNRHYLRMGYLIALGIALHDLPEGIAIAAGYSTSTMLGPLLALAIGLHNIPEGMATAAPLRAGGVGAGKILTLNASVSLVTPLGTILGLFILQTSPGLNALLMAMAAGAMVYIVMEKLLPTSLSSHGVYALTGLAVGFALMLKLNSLL